MSVVEHLSSIHKTLRYINSTCITCYSNSSFSLKPGSEKSLQSIRKCLNTILSINSENIMKLETVSVRK